MELASARSILLCLRYGIGDVIMELDALEALRRHASGARITALAATPVDQLLEADPRVDEVVTIASLGIRHRWDKGTPEQRAAIGAWLDSRRFEFALDVRHAPSAFQHPIWRSGMLARDSDGEVEAAALRTGAGGAAAIRAGVEAGWGLTVEVEASLHIDDAARRRAAELLPRDARAPMGLAPVGSIELKRWPPRRFAAVADLLSRESGRPVLIFGSRRERDVEEVIDAMGERARVIRAVDLPLPDVMALLQRSALLITNDSGLMHVAGKLGTPTVAIFGPTSMQVYRPRLSQVYGTAAAVPCPHRQTGSMDPSECWYTGHCLIGRVSCIEAVEVDTVLDLARQAFGHAGRGKGRRPVAPGRGAAPARNRFRATTRG